MAGKKSYWLDEDTDEPLIAEQAQRLEAFLAALADGRVDEGELQAQQQRLVQLMREVEPLLDEKLHAKVTQLLCELTAYDIMHAVHTMQQARPKTAFRG
ncbi:MAG: hypothetical protein MUE50_24225 [Pirellulaceae bacterium]|jgi:hypothetical protein|nr:hypothetical protein [Pirellulaceae bacterium]MCU0979516.1 hypothetical protein [Pirellulaceae bacterium]